MAICTPCQSQEHDRCTDCPCQHKSTAEGPGAQGEGAPGPRSDNPQPPEE